MEEPSKDKTELSADLLQVLGYLNFSSGKCDLKTLAALNRIYGKALPGSPFEGMPAWLQIQQWLQDELAVLAAQGAAFADSQQAERVLEIAWLNFLPSYLDFHKDLLFHQEPEAVYNGYFLARVLEAVLMQGGLWSEVDRIVSGAMRQLNDYVGYRPVAVLEGRRLEPYDHEWVRPIPIWNAGVGPTTGPYEEVVRLCMEILQSTSDGVLRSALFDLNRLEELSLDPRAYDFDHPVNQRPNYHFGQWDPNRIDNSGYYRRFVVQQVTLDALLARVSERGEIPEEELLFEAAAVLAGTILMASGISGDAPGAFPSTVTLASLLGPIAAYRDAFYTELMSSIKGAHRKRLNEEQQIRRQPFGGARQHLNTHLAKHRASQLEHVQLARLFARMGNEQAANEQSDFVPVPSARIYSRIDCLLTAAEQHLLRGQYDQATETVPLIMDYIHRGIHCGAIVDPWNIMGFAGNFARFEGPDSAIHDHRIDDLVRLMEKFFAVQSRIWRETAAAGRTDLSDSMQTLMKDSTGWWRQFAAHEVAELEATDAAEIYESASMVAKALLLWHDGDDSRGNVKFWAPHAELFDSPKAYALVVESLLARKDFVASMALLVHWLSQAERVGLEKGDDSFSDLARQWMQKLEHSIINDDSDDKPSWTVAHKFFDYLEANAEGFWQPPTFSLSSRSPQQRPGFRATDGDDLDLLDEDDEDNLYGAVWDEVTYKDTTDDGVDDFIPEEGSDGAETTTELTEESNRLQQHLTFLNALAQMWKGAALSQDLRHELRDGSPDALNRLDGMLGWAKQAAANRRGLLELLAEVAAFKIPKTSADHDAMSRYDRQRLVKESLIERIISTAVETADARRMLLANVAVLGDGNESIAAEMQSLPDDDRLSIELVGHLLHGDHEKVEAEFPRLITALRTKKLLYIPLARGGDPALIYSVRLRRRMMSHMLTWLPRQGFYYQACQLIETARFMEHHNPIGPGAVTEFDELFYLCFVSMVQAAVQNSIHWRCEELRQSPNSPAELLDKCVDVDSHDGESLGDLEPKSDELIAVLEQLTEVMLASWLSHSRTLRLSVLESVDNSRSWKTLVEFIQKFGGPLFTQSFLRLGNVRAILHQGVGHWFNQLEEEGSHEELEELFEAMRTGEVERREAERVLSIVLEAVIDHYSEYRDYNSTTTQSDRGEMLYMLLDFLRLRVRYDRVSWNLKPIYWSHEVLVRAGCHQAAQQWRRALSERIGRESENYIENLQKLQVKYAMRLPTVADRLHERFTRPMTVDRMRALVGPSIRQFREHGKATNVFELLIEECKLMMEQPTGVGLDIPQWLTGLEEEVDDVTEKELGFHHKPRSNKAVPFRKLTSEEIAKQLTQASKSIKTLNLTDQ
ncbi:MAG: hypothetical protein Aurels2KO_46060 [Aureliella sp.]